MFRNIIMIVSGFTMIAILSACAGDSYNSGYNSYDNRSSYDRKIDYEAHKDVAEASKMLSAQDIKNIKNLK